MNVKSKMRRFGVLLAGTVVCVLTLVVVANASQTFTLPNAALYTYNLAAGANSVSITPVSNQAVMLDLFVGSPYMNSSATLTPILDLASRNADPLVRDYAKQALISQRAGVADEATQVPLAP